MLKSFRVCFAEGAVSSCRTGLLFDIASAGRALAFWFGDALGAFATIIGSTNNTTMTEKGILDRLGLLLPAKKEKKELLSWCVHLLSSVSPACASLSKRGHCGADHCESPPEATMRLVLTAGVASARSPHHHNFFDREL